MYLSTFIISCKIQNALEFFGRFQGRSDLLAYAAEKGIPVTQTKAKPWSTDENMFHISYEAGILEDPNTTPPDDMWKLTRSLVSASPDGPETIEIVFEKGVPVALNLANGKSMYMQLFFLLSRTALKHNSINVFVIQ